ncbi:trafficking protein particle complex subunit 11 [Rhypophila decipiens]
MDEYPPGSLDHSVPFLLTLGVTSGKDNAATYDSALSPILKEQAILIRSELPALGDDTAHALLRYIQEHDASGLPCNGKEITKRYRFRVRSAERSFLLPPRRARLPDGIEIPPSPTPPVLHSPYSPLSPISPLYPDGLIDTQWILKHQSQVPSVLLVFYTLVSDPTLTTLRDNQIKTDVNNLRGLLSQSGYKTRLSIILLAEQNSPSSSSIQERLENIRKGCGIDSKSFFLVPPHESPEELSRMAENMLVTLQSVAIEYYREMGRHSRKKRSKGVVPQPTIPPVSGTSRTLSLAGWNVRHDFKSAIFAEYRLEMSDALRSYEQAYENLLSSEIMEAIPSWSPRWNEGRLLADIIAVRCLRCLLWNGAYSSAARRWQSHRERMADLIDRRGRGTRNYGFEAWEARWACLMANLIEKAEIPEFTAATAEGKKNDGSLVESAMRLYLTPEKAVMGERLQPWELLHHTGYWYRLAARHLYKRRQFARNMPEEDRRPPSFSPASQVASRAFTYDTYMCPEPYEEYPLESFAGREDGGVDHSQLIVEMLIRARREFMKRGQIRFAAELSLECAMELGSIKDWKSIVELLRPIWKDMSFRREGWVGVVEDLSWTLRTAAVMAGEADLVVAIDYELLYKGFTTVQNWPYDTTRSLEGMTPKSRPRISVSDDMILSFVAASFVFRDEEGKAGQSAHAQLSLTSNARRGSAPVVFKQVQVALRGSVNSIILENKAEGAGPELTQGEARLVDVPLTSDVTEDESSDSEDGSSETEKTVSLRGEAPLTLHAGRTIVFNLEIPLREPGQTGADSLSMSLETETFDLRHLIDLDDRSPAANNRWFLTGSKTKRIARANPLSIRVLPRPPKMEILNPTWKTQYYTNEPVDLGFDVLNQEDVDAPSKLDVVLSRQEEALPVVFTLEVSGQEVQKVPAESETGALSLSGVSLGSIASSKSLGVKVRLQPIERTSEYTLTLRVVYYLSTDPGTPITQEKVLSLPIVNPFEANYDLLPRVHPDPWPTLFDPDGVQVDDPAITQDKPLIPKGISQTWQLVTRYASFASEPLRILDVDILVQTPPSTRVNHSKLDSSPQQHPSSDSESRIIRPKTMEEASFEITARKNTLDDRSPSALDVSLIIKWARITPPADQQEDKPNSTTLPVPRFSIFGTEPRVLASVSYLHLPPPPKEDAQQRIIILTLTIENASNHFLTFSLSLDAPVDPLTKESEFAFSGTRQTTMNLLPVSRRSIDYRILPLVMGGPSAAAGEKKVVVEEQGGKWIKPLLVVRDKYFQKLLRIIPAGEGIKVDKEAGGVLVWVPFEQTFTSTDDRA